MTLFRRLSRNRLTTSTDFEEIDISYKTDRYSNIFDLSQNPDGSRPPPTRPSANEIMEGVKNGTMKRCALSMLEMSEVKEINDFGVVMDAIECNHAGEVDVDEELSVGNHDVDEEDFLLIDSSERSDQGPDVAGDSPMEGGFLQGPTSMSSKMSRSTSMLSFGVASQEKQNLCLSSMMALPDIVEEKPLQMKSCRVGDYVDQIPRFQEEPTEEVPCNGGLAVQVDLDDNDSGKQQEEKKEQKETQEPAQDSCQRSNPLCSSLKRRESNDSTFRSSIKSTDSNDTSNNKMKRNVSFASLEIRSYNLTLGDAVCAAGPAISLDWEYDPHSQIVDIEHYEKGRQDSRRSRREMLMPPHHRKYLLMREAGFSRSEIQRAVDEARRIAKERERTKKMGCLMPVEEVLENTRRKFGKLVHIGNSRRGDGKKA